MLTNWTPESPEAAAEAGITDIDLLEAIDYYRTPRGRHEIAFDAFHLVEELLTQPLQIIVGNRIGGFGSHEEGHELFRRATGEKDLFVIDGASHYDLYDRPEYVGQAAAKLEDFFEENLKRQRGTYG